jgi:transposase-like protein
MAKSSMVRQCFTLTRKLARSISAEARRRKISKSAVLRHYMEYGFRALRHNNAAKKRT